MNSELIAKLPTNFPSERSIKMSPDRKLIVVPTYGEETALYSAHDGNKVQVLDGKNLEFHGGGLMTMEQQGEITSHYKRIFQEIR
jgi:hypothetical protein